MYETSRALPYLENFGLARYPHLRGDGAFSGPALGAGTGGLWLSQDIIVSTLFPSQGIYGAV
jgi:hypothetical protein